jgi:hypothetical protein
VELLLRKFHRICESRNLLNNYGVDEVHQPDKRWLLEFVSTFKPDDEIFCKDYRPPTKANKLSEMKTVDVNKSFFENLVPTKRKVRRRGLQIAQQGLAKLIREFFTFMTPHEF